MARAAQNTVSTVWPNTECLSNYVAITGVEYPIIYYYVV